jgi:hypothetical protein
MLRNQFESSRSAGLRFLSILLFFIFLSTAPSPAAQSAPTDNPTTVLRDAMMAACSQNSEEFRRALTIRNAEAFSRIAPAARATFLKRFVLLDKAGQPKSESTSNETYVVSCTNPDATTLIRIGKADLRDNLAYVPFEIKDASDPSGTGTRQATIGMVREKGQWKLLSLGLLLLDLPSLEEEWDRAEIQANEKAALGYLKELADAVETYRKTYTHLPDNLGMLGPPPQGAARMDKAGLVGEELAAGRKDGYTFRYVIVGANSSGAPAKYELAAIPGQYGRSGNVSLFRDSSGSMHAADRQGAVGSETDPKLE